MSPPASSANLPLILRLGVGLCFIGHGSFGLITKAAWLPYFAVPGIGEELAWRLMPLIGTMDIAVGIMALVRPGRALLVWAAVWATWTALLRPLAGQGWPEFFERAGNYGVPLALLVVVGLRRPWLAGLPDAWPELTGITRARLAWVLRLTTVSLLAGHAGYALWLQKSSLAHHYAILPTDDPAGFMRLVGGFEILLALAVLVRPCWKLLVVVCLWKLASESLFLTSGAPTPVFELIERGGSYMAPLALALILYRQTAPRRQPAASFNPVVSHE